MGTTRPARRASSRTTSIIRRWSSWDPCEKLSRATSIPAPISARTPSTEATAGPSVQTIFVRRGAGRGIGGGGAAGGAGTYTAAPPSSGTAGLRNRRKRSRTSDAKPGRSGAVRRGGALHRKPSPPPYSHTSPEPATPPAHRRGGVAAGARPALLVRLHDVDRGALAVLARVDRPRPVPGADGERVARGRLGVGRGLCAHGHSDLHGNGGGLRDGLQALRGIARRGGRGGRNRPAVGAGDGRAGGGLREAAEPGVEGAGDEREAGREPGLLLRLRERGGGRPARRLRGGRRSRRGPPLPRRSREARRAGRRRRRRPRPPRGRAAARPDRRRRPST